MAEKQEKSNDKGFLARTATYTSKRARRAQEKVQYLHLTMAENLDAFASMIEPWV